MHNLLINTGFFEENEYFNQYISLVQTKAQPKGTKGCQRHHIFPRCLSRYLNQPDNNDKNNLVNLLYCDHIAAHYLLYWSCNHSSLKHKLGNAFHIVFSQNKAESLNDLKLDKIQQLYEEFIQLRSAEYKGRKGPNLGKIIINDGDIEKLIFPYQLNEYLSNGWKKGRKPFSQEDKDKKSNAHKNRILVYKDQIVKRIWPTEFEKYKQLGFKKGISKQMKSKIKASNSRATKGSKWMYKDDEYIFVKPEFIPEYLSNGYIFKGRNNHSDSSNKSAGVKNKQNHTGRVHIHNDLGEHYMIRPEELESYLAKGFKKGSGISIRQKPNVWVNRDGKNKRIPPEQLEDYLADGWVHGMLKNLKSSLE